jgi:hypothetical protein
MTCCGHAGTSGTIQYDPAPTPLTDQMRFFDHYLKGLDNGVENDPPVQLWVLNPPDSGTAGSGFWVNSDTWPLKGTHDVAWFFASDGHANSSSGDGRLTLQSRSSSPDHFSYDPHDPVPTVGGNLCCEPTLLPAGAHDQTQVETRDDVLVYTSETLTEDVAVIGPVKVVLFASTSARDTDFTAKLVDVHPDGFAANVLDRLVPVRFRAGSRLPPSLITPDETYEYTIDLGNAGQIFRKGHKIRVEISSSNFPHYARNLNTGLDNSSTSLIQVARQTIFHEGHEASRLVLPIVPGILPPDRR